MREDKKSINKQPLIIDFYGKKAGGGLLELNTFLGGV